MSDHTSHGIESWGKAQVVLLVEKGHTGIFPELRYTSVRDVTITDERYEDHPYKAELTVLCPLMCQVLDFCNTSPTGSDTDEYESLAIFTDKVGGELVTIVQLSRYDESVMEHRGGRLPPGLAALEPGCKLAVLLIIKMLVEDMESGWDEQVPTDAASAGSDESEIDLR